MKNVHYIGRTGAVVALAVALVAGGFSYTRTVDAANTHAVDLEAGSSHCPFVTDASQTGLDITGNLTIEFWMKIETDSDAMTPLAKWGGGAAAPGNQSWYVQVNGAANTIAFANSDSAGNTGTANVSYTTTAGTWQHVAIVFTASSSQIEVFKDGVSQGTASGTLRSSAQNGDDPVGLGCLKANDAPESFYDGLLDDVRVWNVARTGTEIANNYQTELNGNESGLVAYWKLDNNLNDSTANGNTLTGAVQGYDTNTPFGAFVETTNAYKSADQSVTNSTTLTSDSALKLSLSAGTTYTIEGAIFVSSASQTPDLRIAYTVPAGAVMHMSYVNSDDQGVLTTSGATSTAIAVPSGSTPIPVHFKGTVEMGGASGDLQLKWAQSSANANSTTVTRGSYLRAEHP